MNIANNCVSLLLNKHNPREISEKLDISIGKVMESLYQEIGKGRIRRSDILFSFDVIIIRDYEEIIDQVFEKRREDFIKNPPFGDIIEISKKEALEIAKLNKCYKEDIAELEWDEEEGLGFTTLDSNWFYSQAEKFLVLENDFDKELFKIYFESSLLNIWLGDLYWDLFFIENQLFFFIVDELQDRYGGDDDKWTEGIPANLYKKLEKKGNNDDKAGDVLRNAQLFEILKIINKNWEFFSPYLNKTFGNKKHFDICFSRLNEIRNKVMHPIKKYPDIEDFIFVHQFKIDLFDAVKMNN